MFDLFGSQMLLAAKFCGYEGPAAIRLGAVVELIHTATLVHDDIIDGADTRRGRPSANHRWGNHMSVLAGDWLYMQAFRVALEERSLRVLDGAVAVFDAVSGALPGSTTTREPTCTRL